MRSRMHHVIIAYALLLAPSAQASGQSGLDSVVPTGKITISCMGVNGSGQSPAPQKQGCDTSTSGVNKSVLRGTAR